MSVQEQQTENSDLLIKIVDEQNIEAALKLIQTVGQYQNIVYHLAYRTNAATDMPYIKTTYPLSWMGHYFIKQYQEIDPVVTQGFDRDSSFFWSELDSSTDEQKAFFEDAERHGAGRTGFSVPITDRSQRKALFSVTSNLPDKDWEQKISTERNSLEQIADILHRKAILDVYGSEEGPSLAPREIECLYWTAKGKDCASVAGILNISEHTVRDYLKSARHKLGCHTIAQTIHEATKRRLINF